MESGGLFGDEPVGRRVGIEIGVDSLRPRQIENCDGGFRRETRASGGQLPEFSDETVPIEGTSGSVFGGFGLGASGSPEGVMVA